MKNSRQRMIASMQQLTIIAMDYIIIYKLLIETKTSINSYCNVVLWS